MRVFSLCYWLGLECCWVSFHHIKVLYDYCKIDTLFAYLFVSCVVDSRFNKVSFCMIILDVTEKDFLEVEEAQSWTVILIQFSPDWKFWQSSAYFIFTWGQRIKKNCEQQFSVYLFLLQFHFESACNSKNPLFYPFLFQSMISLILVWVTNIFNIIY